MEKEEAQPLDPKGRVQFLMRMAPELRGKLEELHVKTRVNRNELLREALEDLLKKYGMES